MCLHAKMTFPYKWYLNALDAIGIGSFYMAYKASSQCVGCCKRSTYVDKPLGVAYLITIALKNMQICISSNASSDTSKVKCEQTINILYYTKVNMAINTTKI